MGVPQNGWFIRENPHLEMDDFRKPPYITPGKYVHLQLEVHFHVGDIETYYSDSSKRCRVYSTMAILTIHLSLWMH